ncbi:fatty acid desaturase family protein [Microlunatus speluncae]|uniref:fatty acid desaturase family protein n=1 Tax=Microlunatus speluncae TaxID=2594267 RepID=UPI0012666BAD|nr:acyl-CoA desaturase [Microlunatus speluncae]
MTTTLTLTTDPAPARPGSGHGALIRAVQEAGLLKRTRGFYLGVLAVLFGCTAVAVTGGALLGSSWFQLLIAAGLGVIFTQFAFFAHEAAHRQVFASARKNDLAGLLVGTGIVGISYSWWQSKHSRHHANPNKIGKDPDIDIDLLSFDEEHARAKRGIWAAITRRQGYLFFPLLLLTGLGLHVDSVRSAFSRTGRATTLERILIVLRLTLFPAAVILLLGPGMGAAFLGVQVAVFGFYMGMSFAPNHKGMPIISANSKLDFVHKQVLTSRNIRGRGTTTLMGGLNFQIEHHLFPSMPRPHLRRAAAIVREHCQEVRIPYLETTLPASYARIVSYLNRVGLHARDPFDCPAARALG